MRITPGSGPASLRYVQAERFRGHEIDDELELRRLHHRQIGRVFTFEDATSIDAYQRVHLFEVRSVAHQAAGLREFARCENRWNSMADGRQVERGGS